jgi:hypothetical protein
MSKDGNMAEQKIGQEKTAATVAHYGAVSLTWPKTDTVYESRFGKGGKSTKCIDYSVDTASGLKFEGSLYARLEMKDDREEINFAASLPKGITGPKEATDALIAHVERAAVRWNAYDKACDAAQDRLTGVKPTTTATSRPDMKPRLVQRKPVSTTAAQTVQ